MMIETLKRYTATSAAKYKALKNLGLPDLSDDPGGLVNDEVIDSFDTFGAKPDLDAWDDFVGLVGEDGSEVIGKVQVEWTSEDLPELEFPVAISLSMGGEGWGQEVVMEAHLVSFTRSKPIRVRWVDPNNNHRNTMWVYHCKASFEVENER